MLASSPPFPFVSSSPALPRTLSGCAPSALPVSSPLFPPPVGFVPSPLLFDAFSPRSANTSRELDNGGGGGGGNFLLGRKQDILSR